MIKVVRNILGGMLSVMTASQGSKLNSSPYETLSDALLADWRNIAKDIKRVQGKLKAEAHDGRKPKQ